DFFPCGWQCATGGKFHAASPAGEDWPGGPAEHSGRETPAQYVADGRRPQGVEREAAPAETAVQTPARAPEPWRRRRETGLFPLQWPRGARPACSWPAPASGPVPTGPPLPGSQRPCSRPGWWRWPLIAVVP